MGERGRRAVVWVERAALGAIMTVVAVVVERRLLKALHRRGQEPQPSPPGSSDAVLTAAPQDVEQ
jgi:hypothetical protein